MTDAALKTYLMESIAQAFEKAGVEPPQAQDLASALVQQCEQEMRQAPTPQINLFGDRVLAQASAGDREASEFVETRWAEGVRDEDIRWYWNMTELERRVIDKFAEQSRMALFLEYLDRGQTPEQAAELIRKAHPVYGDPTDDQGATLGNDRRLFPELQDRVDRFIELRSSSTDLRRETERSSSFNAFVRSEMKAGRL